MARASSSLAFLYSGGASNTTSAGSLGGLASTAAGRFVEAQVATPSTIPGIAVEHAARNPIGTGTLNYTASNTTLTWINPLGVSGSIKLTGPGIYAAGNTDTGYLRVSVSSLPGADATQSIAILDALDTLFDSPTDLEIASGLTDYRAFYIQNRSASAVNGVTMTLTSAAPSSTITIGSSFSGISTYKTAPEDLLNLGFTHPHMGLAAYGRSMAATTLRERLTVRSPRELPRFPVYALAAQDSDGATKDVELTIANKRDTGGVLTNIVWGTTLSWTTILPGRMVSFWVRRALPANPSTPAVERVLFDLTFNQS